jgi:hypothetical protein
MRLQATAILAILSVLLAAQTAFGYYNQRLGRWTSEDPLGTDPAGGLSGNSLAQSRQYDNGPNLYEYVAGMVTWVTDPSGLKAWSTGCAKWDGPTIEAVRSLIVSELRSMVQLGLRRDCADAAISALIRTASAQQLPV